VAEIIKKIPFHSCYEELKEIGVEATKDMWYGSMAECSCGKRFVLKSDWRDGDYWEVVSSDMRDR
jgi:hypothetical protein